MKFRLLLAAALAALAFGCGGSGGDDSNPQPGDTDGDGITDEQEGAAAGNDTDADGTPDYQDDDSDGDGIPDYREAGDTDPSTPPVDSDGDGQPDFRDTDSDGNGRADGVDGLGDVDSDGRPDFQDVDDDGDNIADLVEIGPDPANPIDTDGDGTPDFADTDADGDTILDRDDGVEDYDGDGTGNWRDTDSDDDCRGDRVESGNVSPPRDTDGDTRPDFTDRDSDDDGIPDQAEDANCNGVRDGSESDAGNADTDGDGVSDLVETAAGTDANDPADNPQANGDFVFIEPYQDPPSPMDDDLDFQTRVENLDVYVLVDRSGSMSTETNTIKTNLAGVIDSLQCPPAGSGSPATCLSNLYAGLGGIGYQGVEPFRNYLDIQQDPNFGNVNITNVSGTPSNEPILYGAWAAITGNSSAATGCSGLASVPARTNCPAGTFGYPCFRPGVLPVVAVVTDENPIARPEDPNPGTFRCPDEPTVAAAMATRQAKVIGIYGSGSSDATVESLRDMARDTGAVDAAMANSPLVFDGADTAAASAIADGIRTLANGVPLDMGAIPNDDPSDTVDAVAAFVDHLETLQLGSPQCANMLTDRDTNSDSFRDEYVDVRAGTNVCWKLVPKVNNTIMPTDAPQLFRATVVVRGDGVTVLDTRDVFFLVPPAPADPPIE